MENRKRSLTKTIVWRVIATTVTMVVSFIWLGEWTSAFALAITANFIKGILYYIHERVWNNIDFGRKQPAKEDYVI